MSSALDRAIEALSGSSSDLPDALRGLLVVSRRIGSADAAAWLRSELNGFGNDDVLPTYRVLPFVQIEVRFDGPGGSYETRSMHASDFHDDLLASAAKDMRLVQPVAELTALASGKNGPRIELPGIWISRFRKLASEGKVPHLQLMIANDAAITLPKTHLAGLLDRIKSAALDLALDIEEVSAAAGATDGPTVGDDPRLAQAVAGNITNIYATDSTITVGDNAAVASGKRAVAGQAVVQVGDVEGLLREASSLVTQDGVDALRTALERDGGQPAEETRRVLDRVKAGSYLLAGGISQNAAYDGLIHLLNFAFPGFG